MLEQIIDVLGPLKLVVGGILFFNFAWIALHKWLVVGVFGLSVGEVSLPMLWSEVSFANHQVLTYTLIANAALATAIWFGVRGLQLWARSTVKRHEEEFWMLVAQDERQLHPHTARAVPIRFAASRSYH